MFRAKMKAICCLLTAAVVKHEVLAILHHACPTFRVSFMASDWPLTQLFGTLSAEGHTYMYYLHSLFLLYSPTHIVYTLLQISNIGQATYCLCRFIVTSFAVCQILCATYCHCCCCSNCCYSLLSPINQYLFSYKKELKCSINFFKYPACWHKAACCQRYKDMLEMHGTTTLTTTTNMTQQHILTLCLLNFECQGACCHRRGRLQLPDAFTNGRTHISREASNARDVMCIFVAIFSCY